MTKTINTLAAVVVMAGVLLLYKQKPTGFSIPDLASTSTTATGELPAQAPSSEGLPGVAGKDNDQWDKQLSVAEDLNNKVLRSGDDIKKLTGIYGVRENIDRARQWVHHVDEQSLEKNQKVRMRNILFFMRALEFKPNPEREYVLSTIQDLLKNSDLSGFTFATRKSVAADRVELFAILKRFSPKKAEAVLAQADATHKKLYNYAEQFYGLAKKEN